MKGKPKDKKNHNKQAAQSPEQRSGLAFDKPRVNPLFNAFMRLTGEWPLTGRPPLTSDQHKQLFPSNPAFVDEFPIVDYQEDDEVYLFKDYVNVAKIFEVKTRYMAAKSEQALDDFNTSIAMALNALPAEDENAYVIQVYATKQAGQNTGDYLESHLSPELRQDALTQRIVELMRHQSNMLMHDKGLFPDTRMTGDVGWRVGQQSVYLVIYQQRTPGQWKKAKKTPAEQLTHDLTAFQTTMKNAGMDMIPLPPHALINWLAPFFGNTTKWSKAALDETRQLANFDLGQKIFDSQPSYHHDHVEDSEKGIWKFNDKWSRYITLGGIEKPPRSGAITIGEQYSDGSSLVLGPSFFEKLPVGSMVSYAIIPQTDAQIKYEMSVIQGMSDKGASRQARYASEQAETAAEEMMRNNEKIFYAQLGIYLCADSLEQLLDRTESTVAEVRATRILQVVDPQWDLFPQHSYVKNLPCVYDFKNDRRASQRARKSYTTHLASLLPFFGNKSGSDNPCYVMYTRTGEPFYINPFHPKDKERVSHEVFFGPTGSGKSATTCYMTLMSMAVNNPRTFLFDYGGSFKLLADFAEAHGKKVKRIKFSRSSRDVVAPFFETSKALLEVEQAHQINQGTYQVTEEVEGEVNEDENRTYLGEMEAILRVMVTGGNEHENAKLTQTDLSHLSEALARGLRRSVEQGEPHARPIHMADAMQEMAHEEAIRQGGIPSVIESLNNKATALRRWTQGQHGILFNQTASGFDPSYDLTLIEIGNLAKSPDMMAVAGLSAIYNITALAEDLQFSGRSIEVKIDEAHLWAKIKMLIDGLIVGAKVFRKLGTWLCMITQDISDFAGDSAKILTNAEFWWLMRMSPKEINQAAEVLDLDDEVKHLIMFPQKEGGRFVEGVSISEKYPDTLIRYVLPSLVLALAQTESTEKEQRAKLMAMYNCSELEAAYRIADDIDTSRLAYQQSA